MKIVVYTQRVEVIESYKERRDCADQRIADFLVACGYLPLPVPNNEKVAEALIYAIKPAGIVLTGGNSLVMCGGNAPERDAVDELFIRMSIKEGIPLYGFCRGMQSILVHFGNDLEDVSGHVAVRHAIRENEEQIIVNSYHNQACKRIKAKSGLEVVGIAEDGVIEEVRHQSYPIVGTMWHPEREVPFSMNDINRLCSLLG